jgi:ribonuclease P protein component
VGASLVLFGEPNGLEHPRLGVTATRKFGGAVARNRIKRVLRDVFRRNRPSLAPPLDVVVNVRQGALERPFEALEREFIEQYRLLARRFRT